MLKALMEVKTVLTQGIERIFNREHLNALARVTKFVQRSTSRLEGFELIGVLTGVTAADPYISYEGLCDEIAKMNPDADITPQALEQRINSDNAVEYVKEVFEDVLREKLSRIEIPEPELLKSFENVYIEDSTQAAIHEKLSDNFKGSGGSASKAAVKIDFIYNIKKMDAAQITIRAGADPDQGMAYAVNDIMKESDLKINDLGYFSIPSLKDTADKNAFYLSRISKSANVYLTEHDSEPVNLPEYINRNFGDAPVIDIYVYLGKEERFRTRLVVYRHQQEVSSRLRQKARDSARRKGRTPSEEYMAWLDFAYFVTNVPADVWPAKVVGTIYRIRWQIELIFKNWKSLLNIHVLKGFKPERILCLLYGRLTAIVVLTLICKYAAGIGRHMYNTELSFFKLISWMKRHMRIREFLMNPEKILTELTESLPRLMKQKRKRKTTLELIEAEVGYLETLEEKIHVDKEA